LTKTCWRRGRYGLLAVVLTQLALATEVDAQAIPEHDIGVRVDFGWRPASRTFAGTKVFPAFSEQGNFHTDYEISGGGILDGGLSILLWRNLAVALDVVSYRSVNRAQITSEIPHPFFFDLPRSASGEAAGLERKELGLHIRAQWVSELTDWLIVSVSSGPSLINAKQDLISAVEHTEVGFPFDEIEFDNHIVTTQSSTIFGWNAGVDMDAFVLDRMPGLKRFDALDRIGLGVLLRYVRGAVDFNADDTPVQVDLGGLQVTTGLRLRF